VAVTRAIWRGAAGNEIGKNKESGGEQKMTERGRHRNATFFSASLNRSFARAPG
jgi:hypothetical protein